jgi:Uma2 family endonuclease
VISALDERDVYAVHHLDDVPDAHRFELVDGALLEKHMGSLSSWVGGELYALLREYVRANRYGWVWHADAGFECFRGRATVRYPDVAALRFGRLPGEQLPDGHIEVAPDFVAEVVSPNDRIDDLEQKLIDYRNAGVRLAWVIFPALRIARVHRPDRSITEVGENDLLTGEGVLPGFQVRLGDLFPVRPVVPPAPAAQPPVPPAPNTGT